MYKFLIIAAVAACAQAGYVSPYGSATYAAAPAYGAAYQSGLASPAIGHSAQSVLRSADGSAAISQYSKSVDTAFSSVRKSDVRVSNPGYASVQYRAPLAYAAPAYAPAAYAAPVAHAPVAYAAPAAYAAAPAYAAAAPVVAKAGLVGVAYSAAPAVAHISYDSPIVHYGW